jgi:hypothetical protein
MVWDAAHGSWVWPAGSTQSGGLSNPAPEDHRNVINTQTGEVIGEGDSFGSTGDTPGYDPAKQIADQKIAADEKAARDLRDALVAERQVTPGTAPQVTGPSPIPAAQVGMPQDVGALRPEAARAAAPAAIATPGIAATPLAAAVQAQNAQINALPQQQFRGDQADLVAGIKAAAFGTGGPSAAELLAQKASQDAIRDQAALAGSVHGYGALAAHRQAARQMAQLDQNAALAAAIARAKETETARGQLIQATGEARGQDINLASSQATLEQQAKLQNAQLGTAVSQTNAELLGKRATTEATLGVDVSKANQDAELRTALANAANEQQANVVGATETNKVAMENADRQLKADMANAGFTQQSLLQLSDQELKTKLANAGFQLTQEQINAQRQDAANQLALQATSALLNYQTGQQQLDMQRKQLAAQIDQARRAGDFQLLGTWLTVAGTVGGALIGGPAGAAVGGAAGAAAGQGIAAVSKSDEDGNDSWSV